MFSKDNNVKLSKRLETIASVCQPSKVLADVGCDHAYLSLYLVKSGIVEKSIAMDLREGPLSKARENIKSYGLEERIQTRLSDGLEKLEKDEADMVLISGMGGILICDILSRGKDKISRVNQLILQPQSDQTLVRKYLHDNGFVIDDEKMCIDDGKYYTCIHAVKGESQTYKHDFEYEYGKILIDRKDKYLTDFLEIRIKKNEEILVRLYQAGHVDDEVVSRIRNELYNAKEALATIMNLE